MRDLVKETTQSQALLDGLKSAERGCTNTQLSKRTTRE